MFKVEKRVKLESSDSAFIIKIFPLLDKYFVVIDNSYRAYIYDSELKKITKTARLIGNTTKFEFFRGLDFLNGELALATGSNIILFELAPKFAKKLVLDIHDSDVEIVKYSNTNKYLISTAHSGRVILYSTDEYQPLFYMPKRKDFAYSLNFSSDDRFLVLNFYDKESIIFDILTYKIYDSFETKEIVEFSTFFDENKQMFFITRDGFSYIYNMVSKETIALHHFPIKLISTHHLIENRYLLFSDREDRRLFMYDLEKKNILFQRIYDCIVTSIFSTAKYIFICGDGFFDIINRDAKLEQAQIHLMVKDYRKAHFCAKANIFLNINKEFKEAMNIGWSESLPLLIENINQKNTTEAHNIASTFDKLDELEGYMQKSFIFNKFNLAISTGNIKLSYDIISHNEFLKDTPEFRELEKYWLKMFLISKKLIANKEFAKLNKLLKPFLDINGKRELIQSIIKHPNLISKAETLSMTRDYKNFFELLEAHPFLIETDYYKRVLASGYTLYEKFNKFYEDFDLNKCKRIAETLIHFKEYKDEIMSKLEMMSNIEKIKALIEQKEYEELFEMLNNNRELFYNEHIKFFIDDLEKLFDSLLPHLKRGEPNIIRGKLAHFMNIEIFEYKIDFLMKLAYINEIKRALSKNKESINLAKTVAKFLNIFGADTMLIYNLNRLGIKIKVPTNIKNSEDELQARVKNFDYVNSILV